MPQNPTENRHSFKYRTTLPSRTLAVTSGKGGVGKTCCALNLAITLASQDKRVCLIDADIGLANVNIMLGLTPRFTLEHFLNGEVALEGTLMDGPKDLKIIPAASGFVHCVDWDVRQQQQLISGLASLEDRFDYLIVDTAAGISPSVLHFVMATQLAVLVITPEPTSLTDAFSALKSLKRRGYKRTPQVLVNMAPDARTAGKVYRRFSAAVAKYLEMETEMFGSVWRDATISNAVARQVPVTIDYPLAASSHSFVKLSRRLTQIYEQTPGKKPAFTSYWRFLVNQQKDNAKPTFTIPNTQTREQRQSPPNSPDQSDHPWLTTRKALKRFLLNDNVSIEQIQELSALCLDRLAARAPEVANDLTIRLLQQTQSDNLTTRQQIQMKEYLRYLLDNNPHPLPKTIEQNTYDASTFGKQHKLLEKLREQGEEESLSHLLETIKLASLVDS